MPEQPRCPTCRQRIGTTPVKVCAACKRPMKRPDKYVFNAQGRIQHRHCDNPTDYFPKAARERYHELRRQGKEAEAWAALKASRPS